jgi:hypothetical protein
VSDRRFNAKLILPDGTEKPSLIVYYPPTLTGEEVEDIGREILAVFSGTLCSDVEDEEGRGTTTEDMLDAGLLDFAGVDLPDGARWPDARNRGLLQAAKQAEAALTKYIQSNEPRNTNLLYEAQSYLRPAIKREEEFRSASEWTQKCADGVQEAPAPKPPQWPAGLLDRIKAAEQRIADNHAPRRIPADPHGDVDLVLAEVRYLIEGCWPPFWIKDAAGVDSVDGGQKNGN